MFEIENEFASCRKTLAERLSEPAPGRIQILAGARQVGKTTLLLELIDLFGELAIYAVGDDPHAARMLLGRGGGPSTVGTALLLFYEVHRIPDWAAKLKGA